MTTPSHIYSPGRPGWAKPATVGYVPSKLRQERDIAPGDLVKWHPCARNVLNYVEGEHVGLVLRYLGLRDAVIVLTPSGEHREFFIKFIEKSS